MASAIRHVSSWKAISAVFVNVDGVWKKTKAIFVNVDGVWTPASL